MKKTYILSIVAFMLLTVNYVNAQSTISPTMDTFIQSNVSTSSFGTSDHLEIRNGGAMRISFMDIPVNTISSFSAVTSAMLNVYLWVTPNTAESIEVYQVLTQGAGVAAIDNNATWGNANATYTLGSTLASITLKTGDAVGTGYSFNLTNFIKGLTPGTQKITLCFKIPTTNATGPEDFCSIEHATAAWHPALVVSSGAAVISVTGVTVNPTSASVAVGATTNLTATVVPSNATNQTVNWTSSNTGVATVTSSGGVVTGVSAGNATITATTVDGSFISSSSITVTSAAVNYVLNPSFELNTAPSATAANWYKWTGSPNNYIINSNVVTGNALLGDAVGGTPHNGTNYLSIAPSATWATTYDVLNKQDITGLTNGTYTLKAWFRGNGGGGYFNIGGTYINFTMPMSQWTQIVINNVSVTNGTASINIQYNSTTGTQLDVDDIQFTLNPSVTTAAPQVEKNNNVLIYPTVIANNVLNISNSVKGNYEVSISNINGQTMYQNKLNSGNVSINTAFLKNGMYLVRVSNGIENQVQKVIIP